MVDFVCVGHSGSAVQYKLHAQFLRLFSLHDDVNDAHRAGANRLQNKQTTSTVFSNPNFQCKTWEHLDSKIQT